MTMLMTTTRIMMAMLMTMIMMLMMKDNNTDAIPSCKSVRSGYSGFGLPIDPCHCRDLFFTTIIVVIINIHLYHINIMILFFTTTITLV